jgi:hypothetical protein
VSPQVSAALACSFVLAKGQRSLTKAVLDSLPEDAGAGPRAVLSRFRLDFHACLTARADELFELTDAVLCTETLRLFHSLTSASHLA